MASSAAASPLSPPLLLAVSQIVCLLLSAATLGVASAADAALSPPSGADLRAVSGTSLRFMTPLRLQRIPLQYIDQDTDLPSSGRFELSPGVTVAFSSPNYPDDYPPRVWTSWKFSVAGQGSLELSCPDYQLGEQDQLAVQRGDERRVKFAASAPPQLSSDAPLLVELRTRRTGRLRCTMHALADGGATAQSAPQRLPETVSSRQPVNTQTRPLLSENAQVPVASKPLFTERRPASAQNRPLFPEAGPVIGETKPLFPETEPFAVQNRPLFAAAIPIIGETKPLFPETGSITGENRPLFPVAGPVNAISKPLFAEPKPVAAESRPLFPASIPVNAISKPLFAEPKPVAAESRPLFSAENLVATETKPLLGLLSPIASENKPLFPASGPVRDANDSHKQEPEPDTPEAMSMRISDTRPVSFDQIKSLDEYSVELQKSSLNSQICGRVLQKTRIVGGDFAQEKAYPWLAGITSHIGSVPFCGAAIINERFLVTAAHCVRRKKPRRLSVMVKKRKRFLDSSEVRLPVESITVHPAYNGTTQFNDIAIIQVKRSMADLFAGADGRVRPVCLPTSRCSGGGAADPACFAGRTGSVAGWGITNPVLQSSSSALLEVQLPILNNTACRASYHQLYSISDRMLCAGLQLGGKDTCQGDSGGPLAVTSDDGVFTVVGVVSFGKGCAEPGNPGVYTRVSEYLDWIIETTRL